MKNYFDKLSTVESVKNHYKSLCKLYHPDLGGDEDTMKEINAQYHEKLRSLDGVESQDDQGRTHTYTYHEEIEQSIIDKIRELLALKLPGYIKIYLIGTWVWIVGTMKADTEIRDQLKECSMRWNRQRECWCWSPWKHKGRNSRYGLGTLAARYGAREIATEHQRLLAC